MTKTKKIVSLQVVKPGSNPDVDSDFNTKIREKVVNHIKDIYGVNNVASIGTFQTLAAKGSFKSLCTIYEVPFSQANKVSELIPQIVKDEDDPDSEDEGMLSDLYDPRSSSYSAGADFRSATSGEEWKKIIAGALAMEGRNKTTGVHPCGLVISSKPLEGVVPLNVRQNDGLVVSQWTYPQLESLGLIKMDLLGLDTVDLIQHAIENIVAAGKTPPNMVDVIHGPMDDKKVYDMLGRGESIGIFQMASDGVRDLLKRMKPTTVDDLIATTALFRPGPMAMQSHIRYADRKNGREEMSYPVHPDFKGTELETILGKTYFLVVYQEQILQIANRIAGMTLQEGDDLRKAMGKKIIPKMMAIKPKFVSGGEANGYSTEAMEQLWDTCAEFAKYGFNKAHSVAYGITAYQAAFLKANYPVEFMAALLAQNVGVKNKILMFLQEAQRMGLSVGSVNVNTSEVRVSPDYSRKSGYDIVYGFSGVNGVSTEISEIIIQERQRNGLFKSVQDMIDRCAPLGVSNRRIYENIAKAGGFDDFGVSRKAVVENLNGLLGVAKTKEAKGASLFDLFGENSAMESSSVDLKNQPEYPHVEKLKYEAEIIGLYLTSHPLANVGPGLSKARSTTISNLRKSSQRTTATITAAVTDVTKKIQKRTGSKSIIVTLDDGTGLISANVSKELVKGIDKQIARDRLKKLYVEGESEVPEDMEILATNSEYIARKDIEKNSVYVMSVTYQPPRGESSYGARINSIEELELSEDGSLPIRMRFVHDDETETKMSSLARKLPRSIAERNPGDYPIFVAEVSRKNRVETESDAVYKAAAEEIRHGVSTQKESQVSNGNENLWGGKSTTKKKNVSKNEGRVWPPKTPNENSATRSGRVLDEWGFMRGLEYVDTGLRAAKTKRTELDIEKYLGVENYDFGWFDETILED